jgi:hypothetical protein
MVTKEKRLHSKREVLRRSMTVAKKSQTNRATSNRNKSIRQSIGPTRVSKKPSYISKPLFVSPPPKKKEKKPRLTNLNAWKKAHDLSKNSKVYIVSKGYGDLRRDLDERGWHENEDSRSMCFNMKWVVKIRDIPYSKLNN